MDMFTAGSLIRELRRKKGMTQAELAGKLGVTDKTVSKWETAKGCPDISLLAPTAEALGVSVSELLAGSAASNTNVSANMLRSKLCVCPVCGNVIHSTGGAAVFCHGVRLVPCEARRAEGEHEIICEESDGEFYVRLNHEMTREHCITFIAGVSTDRLELVRLYPEGGAETRLRMGLTQRIYAYCSRDGLFCIDLKR